MKSWPSSFLRGLGIIAIVVGLALVVVEQVRLLISEGYNRWAELNNPLNPFSAPAIVLVFALGFGLLWLAGKLKPS